MIHKFGLGHHTDTEFRQSRKVVRVQAGIVLNNLVVSDPPVSFEGVKSGVDLIENYPGTECLSL